MANNVMPFAFEGAPVRVVEIDGEPWFVAKDVATILGYANPQEAVRVHCKSRRPLGVSVSLTPGMDPQTVIIPERDVYRLIMRSKLPTAERFEEWVVGEVLPSIRKIGGYGTAALDLSNPDHLLPLLSQYAEDKKRLQARIKADQPKTAFYDRFATAEGLYGLQNAARVLGQSPNKFIGWLKQGYLFYQGAALVPKVQYREMGIFEVKAAMVDDKARHQTYVTPKGIQYLARKLGVDQLPLGNA